MLARLEKDELVKLADENSVRVDKRWSRERIIAALEKAEVAAPERNDESLVAKIAAEPVRFTATIGRIVVREGKEKIGQYGPYWDAGITVDFGGGFGTEAELTGGGSHQFYPDLDDHDIESAYCPCASCLAEVRDYVALDPHNLVGQWHIMEDNGDVAVCPLPSAKAWQDLHVQDLKQLRKLGALEDLRNAIRYEQKTHKRAAVIAELDAMAAEPVEVKDADILEAELTV